MSNATGPIRKFSFDNTNIYLTNDNEVNFWPGGLINTESQDDINGATPKTEFRAGMISGITSRCGKQGSLKALYDLVQKTTVGDVDIVITMANGDKWSGACFSTADPESFFNNQDGKATFNLCPRAGVFSPL